MLWDLVGGSDPSDSQDLNQINDSDKDSPSKMARHDLFGGHEINENEIDPMAAMKDALLDIKVECKRVKDGCTFTEVPIADIDTHEKDHCEFRQVHCDRVGCQLQEAIPWNLL